MQITLDTETRNYLRKLRKKERDKKRYIKISVILALDAGHSAQEVADILGLDDATIYRYAALYRNEGVENYLKQNWVPYVGKLTQEQREAIRAEVSSRLYTSARAVAAWIECKFGIHYHEKHVVKLLHSLGFRYKKTQVVPGKADAQAQEAHVAAFEQLMAEKQEDTIVFLTMARIRSSVERLWQLLKKEKINRCTRSIWYDCFEDFKQGVMNFFNYSHLWEMERRATAEIVGNPTFQNNRLLILYSNKSSFT